MNFAFAYYLYLIWKPGTPETRYSKPRYSKILDIVNKTQLPLWDFIEILYIDIVNDST